MVHMSRRLIRDRAFQAFITLVIIANAALVGLETFPEVVAREGAVLTTANMVILAIFIFEIAVRLVAYWPRPQAFFRVSWNVFDFVIVAVSLLPAVGTFATVARLGRLLRVLRLISAFPELRLIVGTMLRSIRSIGSVLLLMSLVVYVYAILGVNLFGAGDPENWGSLGTAVLTLFGMLTLEGWLEVQDVAMSITPFAWVFFGSYVLIAVFVIVNLFVAVVLNNLEDLRTEARVEAARESEILTRIGQLRNDLELLEHELRAARSADDGSPATAAIRSR